MGEIARWIVVGMIVGGLLVAAGYVIADYLAERRLRHYVVVINDLIGLLKKYDPVLSPSDSVNSVQSQEEDS